MVLSNTLHYSTKYANSLIKEAPGCRLKKNVSDPDAGNLPYVSLQGLIHDDPSVWESGLDVVLTMGGGNGAKTNVERQRVFKGYVDDLVGDEKPYTPKCGNITPVEKLKLEGGEVAGLSDGIKSPRVKQILVPNGDTYISLTPVESTGISKVIKSLSYSKKNNPNGIRIPKAVGVPIGGTKPANVSINAAKQFVQGNVIFSTAPMITPEISKTLSLQYKDMRIRLDYKETQNISKFLDSTGILESIGRSATENILQSILEKALLPFMYDVSKARKSVEHGDIVLTPFNEYVMFGTGNETELGAAKVILAAIYRITGRLGTNEENLVIEMIRRIIP